MAATDITPIRIDFKTMFAEQLGPGPGLTPEMFEPVMERAAVIHEGIQARRESGELGFFDLPYQDTEPVKELAGRIRDQADDLLVLGIGGSALGARALKTALCHPFYDLLPDALRDGPRLFIVDNVDPDTFSALLAMLDGRRVFVNAISKSGGTAETMSQFMIMADRLKRELGAEGLKERMILTTDPQSGNFRTIAGRLGLRALDVPPGVGGRFSVLSPVGLLPAAVMGIDIDALLAGAAAMDERCRTGEVLINPAYGLGACLYLAHAELGRNVHVLMPYADGLEHIADWYAQLWAESLGKRLDLSGAEINAGPTPVAAKGVTDQHSQLQLYAEGPFDKVIMFMTVTERRRRMPIAEGFSDIEGIAYLGGHDLGDLLEAEALATRAALTQAGRMNLSIELESIDGFSVGQVLMMFQVATVFAGGLYNINPMDQPGVELGKKLTYGLMGRPGFEQYAEKARGDGGGK